MSPVSLKNVSEEFELISAGLVSFLDTADGEVITLSADEMTYAESEDDLSSFPEWEQEVIRQARQVIFSEHFLPLPDASQIDHYELIKQFCLSLENPAQRETMLRLIDGSGAFRRFKNGLARLGLMQSWDVFRRKAYTRLARTWLEQNNISFADDV